MAKNANYPAYSSPFIAKQTLVFYQTTPTIVSRLDRKHIEKRYH